MNLYAYVGNDPLNAWDPKGKVTYSSQVDAWAAGIIGVGVSYTKHWEVNENGEITGYARSFSWRWGPGLGTSVGVEIARCGQCTLEDVASGDSMVADVDIGIFGGDISGVEDADDDQPFVKGEKHQSLAGSYGFGAGFFVGMQKSYNLGGKTKGTSTENSQGRPKASFPPGNDKITRDFAGGTVTYDKNTGKVTFSRQETGSRIPRTETRCVDKSKCE